MKKRRKIDSFQFSHRIDDVTINNSKHSTFPFVSVFVLNAIRQCCRLLFACDWEKFLYLRSVNISTFIVFDESRRRIRRGHHHYEIIQLLSMRIELSIRKLIKTLQQQLNTRTISLCFGHFLRNKIYLASFFVTLLTSFHCSIHFKKRLQQVRNGIYMCQQPNSTRMLFSCFCRSSHLFAFFQRYQQK